MRQQLFTMILAFVVQYFLIAICAAYPQPPFTQTKGIHKRSFDMLDNSGFSFGGTFGKRAFDRLDDSAFGLVKRSIAKRAFDRLDSGDFGLRRKRAFDRLSDSDFGLMKRSIPADADSFREELVNELASSIQALRRAREFEEVHGEPPQPFVVVQYDDEP
ncbi:hypothetical protein WR25_02299 [Diploscapter pachys]|uniref:Uncharacterized protein n=1 Tax=Diploscapter pachys TaxID=2018661 RepID=A0A2A2J7D9_9BILA|nr:hypothetical protein WR25_02299 [Diploscapter pachys]